MLCNNAYTPFWLQWQCLSSILSSNTSIELLSGVVPDAQHSLVDCLAGHYHSACCSWWHYKWKLKLEKNWHVHTIGVTVIYPLKTNIGAPVFVPLANFCWEYLNHMRPIFRVLPACVSYECLAWIAWAKLGERIVWMCGFAHFVSFFSWQSLFIDSCEHLVVLVTCSSFMSYMHLY